MISLSGVSRYLGTPVFVAVNPRLITPHDAKEPLVGVIHMLLAKFLSFAAIFLRKERLTAGYTTFEPALSKVVRDSIESDLPAEARRYIFPLHPSCLLRATYVVVKSGHLFL